MPAGDPARPATKPARLHGLRPRALRESVFEVVSRTTSQVGEAYFPVLAEALCDVLGCSGSFIGERPPRLSDTMRPLAVYSRGAFVQLDPFPLPGSAAEPALTGAAALHIAHARQSFADDTLLSALSAESCLMIGIPAPTGDTNGLLGVADGGPLDDPLTIEAVLRLLAPRVGAEIERLAIGAKLREEAELSRAFMDRAQDVILRTRPGPAPTVDYVNPAFERFTGYPVGDLYADPQLLLRIAHPDDRDKFAQMLLSGDATQPTVWRWIRRDGSTLWTEGGRRFLYDDHGAVIAIETIARDITLRKEAEALASVAERNQRVLLEAVPDTIIRVTPGGEIVDYTPSRSMASPFKATPLPGQALSQLLPASAWARILQHITVALESDSTQSCRFEIAGDEADLTFEARIAPADAGAVMFFRDISAEDFLFKAATRERAKEELELKAERRILRRNPHGLTFREFTVLELVARGMTDRQIAAELGISLNTVGKHVSNILGKMQVSSRTEASVRAVQERLLD